MSGGRLILLAGALLLAAGCASRGPVDSGPVADPFEPANRGIYQVNDVADRAILRPAAVGFRRGLPPQFRSGIRNFFDNALYPVTIVNNLLQGKFADGGRDLARFALNTTVGLVGLFDPASDIGLPKNDEDFGQTLGVWGVPEGPFLMVPVFGPYTLRSGVGALLDLPLTPWLLAAEPAVGLGLWAVNSVESRTRFLDVDRAVREAFDPYIFVRDAFIQNQRYRTADGNLPDDHDYLDDLDDEDFAEDPDGT